MNYPRKTQAFWPLIMREKQELNQRKQPFTTCQYIAGDEISEAHKCGKPTYGHSAYCEEHYHLCVIPQSPILIAEKDHSVVLDLSIEREGIK